MIRPNRSTNPEPTPEDWQALGPVMLALRGQAGAPDTADPVQVARCADGAAGTADMRALARDGALRRNVAATVRLLPRERTASSWRFRRGAAGLAAAAVLAGLLFVVPRPPDHRGRAPVALEVAPAVAAAGGLRVTWQTVLGADAYEVEITGAAGATVYRFRTSDTLAMVPASVLDGAARHFYRVRARIDADRWIASDFRELVHP